MPVKEVNGKQVNVNDEGFLVDPSEWDKAVAETLAAEEGIDSLNDTHWKVIEFMRNDYEEHGKVPTIRRINKVGGVSTKELYSLFPNGPAKKAAKIAGLGKPQGCV
jgi:tRNA 2-thiouridine synthesizing protein E